MKHIKLFEEFEKGEFDPKAEVRHRGHCVLPAEDSKVKDNKDHFPINDKKQGRNALARVNQYKSAPKWFDGTLEELKDKVVDAVKDKFSSIEVDEEKYKD